MMLLTADDASRATSDLHKERPGVRTEYDAARTTRIASAMISMSTTVAGAIDLIDSPTLSNSVTLGMIAANSSTTRPPESAALNTLRKTENGPGRSPVASAGRPAPVT